MVLRHLRPSCHCDVWEELVDLLKLLHSDVLHRIAHHAWLHPVLLSRHALHIHLLVLLHIHTRLLLHHVSTSYVSLRHSWLLLILLEAHRVCKVHLLGSRKSLVLIWLLHFIYNYLIESRKK